MQTYEYLIVGSGMTADAAARGIREHDDVGRIGIIGDDVDPPYTRPALTKRLWTDPNFTDEDNWLRTDADTEAELRLNTTVTRINLDAHTVETGDDVLGYGKLLLATGATVKTMDPGPGERVIYFRSFSDYRALRSLSAAAGHIAVVGGGYIGIELAAALVQNNTRTTLVYPEATLAATMFPEQISDRLEQAYAQAGVELLPESSVVGGHDDGASVTLRLDNGDALMVDAAVMGLGVSPSQGLASDAGLDTSDGIVVDEMLATSAEDVFAAGDVAYYPDRLLGRRRIEHVDNATSMGRAAGRNMAGGATPYTHTPYFYSKVFDIHYQAVGRLDSELHTVIDWSHGDGRAVVYYLGEDGSVAGVLLWNVEDKLDAARAVIAEGTSVDRTGLEGRI